MRPGLVARARDRLDYALAGVGSAVRNLVENGRPLLREAGTGLLRSLLDPRPLVTLLTTLLIWPRPSSRDCNALSMMSQTAERIWVYCFTASANIVLSISSEFKVAVFIRYLLD